MQMKRILFTLAVLTFTDPLFAFSCQGNCQLTRQRLDSVYAAGKLVLDGTTVTGDTHSAGNFTANAAHINRLFAAGKTELNNTVVEGKTKIAGKAIANGSTFNADVVLVAQASFTNSKLAKDIRLAGKTEMVNTRVVGRVKAAGMLIAKRSVFDNTVTLTASKAIFSRSQLNKDLVVNSKKQTPTIELLCDSKLKGNIVFAGMAGIVKTEHPTEVKWQIKNGRLEQANRVNCTQ
jgi:hypothetical protein